MATFLTGSGPLCMNTVNNLFGRGTCISNYRGTTYYTSTGGPFTFPSPTMYITNLYGSGPSSAYSANYAGGSVYTGQNQTHTSTMYINTDGTITLTTNASYNVSDMPKNWYLPTTGGIGSSYYWRYTYTNYWGNSPLFAYNNGATAAAQNTWYSLSTYGRVQLSISSGVASDGLITIQTSNNASTVLYTGSIFWTQNEFMLP